MGLTNFPGGISSFGNPIFAGAMQVPLMGSMAKAFFVDAARGSDGNRGTDWRRPLASVSKAYSLTTDKAGDVVYLLNDGNTSGTSRESATITWAKDNTHLIGLCAPTMLSQRARISTPTSDTATIVSPQLTVSGNGNIFMNFALFEGNTDDATASESVRVTGHRNYFQNVAMMNMGDATNGNTGDEADSCNLKISAGRENTFIDCYIGLDTAKRTAANANVELVSGATRNIFRGCIFPCWADATAPYFIKVDAANDIDRWVLFDNCTFINADQSSGTTMDAAIVTHASQNGHIIIKECQLIGCDDWTAADNTKVRLCGSSPDGTLKSVGIAQDVDIA